MQQNSNWTGRSPRSLNEAFGPYSRLEEIHHRKRPTKLAAIMALVVAIYFGAQCAIYFLQLKGSPVAQKGN